MNGMNIIEDKIVSDACEALIGAIFYDQGIKIVEKFILDLWSNNISNSVETKVDAKTKLQEYSLKIQTLCQIPVISYCRQSIK